MADALERLRQILQARYPEALRSEEALERLILQYVDKPRQGFVIRAQIGQDGVRRFRVERVQ